MKTSLICLFIALALNVAFTQNAGVFIAKPPIEKEPRDIIIANGSAGHWATVARFNKREKDVYGFDPSYTVVFVKYLPVVKKIGDVYQITFTSEIAKDIP